MGVIAPHLEQPSVADKADARLTVLHGRHGRSVLRYCRRRTGSNVEADDAFQQTFVHAMRGLRSGVDPRYELAWLLAIARNVCSEHWRTYQRRPHLVDDLDAIPDYRPMSDGDRSLALDLDEALAQLPLRHRTAILLREWRGLSYADIAAQMELTESAVESLLVRARRELAAALEQGTQPRKRRASWLDLTWVAALARRIAKHGASAKLLSGAAVVAVTVSTGGASPTGSRFRDATHLFPTSTQAQVGVASAPRREIAIRHRGTGLDPGRRTRSTVTEAHPGPTAVTSPGRTPVVPVAPQVPTKTGPTATAPAESPPVQVPSATVTAPILTVTVPAVDLPAGLPSTPVVTVTTPAVDIQTPAITVPLPDSPPTLTGT